MLRGAAVWAGVVGLVVAPIRGWAAPAPSAVQPLVQPQPQNAPAPRPRPRPVNAPAGTPQALPSPAAAGAPATPTTTLPAEPPPPRRLPTAPRPEAFGRWQPRLQSCARNLAGAGAGECGAVLVDQRSAGVMRVSWPGRGGGGQASVLIFVGTLAGGAEPMACRQAICRFSKPIELSLSTVSESLFDGRGIASGLPSAWPVTGSCRLEARRIRCEAKAFSGESWTASADLN